MNRALLARLPLNPNQRAVGPAPDANLGAGPPALGVEWDTACRTALRVVFSLKLGFRIGSRGSPA
jgi:hypothetical protein